MKLYEKNAAELSAMLQKKECSAVELTQDVLERIEEKESAVGAYVTRCEDCLDRAKAVDDARAAGKELHPLAGIPIGIKDNISTKGIRTTCSSKMLGNYVPPFDATVMQPVREAGMVITGKMNMDEFAMGSSTETSYFHTTHNPHNLECVPGGSSGGSAAAVAAGEAILTLGSDTGGSIRQPASLCGVVGLKPTYGRVSRYGLVAFASSLDQIGPIAKNAQDCAWILNAIAGFDPHDGTSSKRNPEDYTAKLGKDIKGLKIAIPKEFYAEGIDDEVRNAVMQAARTYEKMGAELVECSMPSLKYAVAAYYLIASAEASSNLSRYDGIKYGHRSKVGDTFQELICNSRSEGFGSEVKRRILLGNYALSSGYYDAYYGKAMALKQRISAEYAHIFETCDVILTPTTPSVAYGVHENISDPVKMYQADICTVTVNIASLPAISTPCGYNAAGMPIGMSIVGKQFDEATILQVADAFEQQFETAVPVLK